MTFSGSLLAAARLEVLSRFLSGSNQDLEQVGRDVRTERKAGSPENGSPIGCIRSGIRWETPTEATSRRGKTGNLSCGGEQFEQFFPLDSKKVDNFSFLMAEAACSKRKYPGPTCIDRLSQAVTGHADGPITECSTPPSDPRLWGLSLIPKREPSKQG